MRILDLLRVNIIGESVEFIYCHCQCGFTRSKYKIRRNGKPNKSEPRFFIHGHQNRDRKHSDETKKKFSESHKDKKLSEEHKKNIGKSSLGRKVSLETRRKISEAQKGEKGHMFGKLREKSSNWRGDNIGYRALHNRIRNILKKPEFCEICGLVPPDDLSNKSQKYLHDKTDWWYLCTKCHIIYDKIYDKIPRDPKTGRFMKRQ